MGDKKSDNLHCPCCKRHCSLDDLHCSKGKVYAKSRKEKEGKGQQQKQMYEPSYNRILLSYKIGFDRLFGQKKHGINGKRNRMLVMGALFHGDQKTIKELKSDTGIVHEKLVECLKKLEKKEYVIKKKESEGGHKYSLSKEGMKAAEALIKEGDKEMLSRLNEEERDHLEQLLKKISC
ncbi:winged helix-turn-helix transcriptional regulator [Clostridium sp. E02]|uniref:MarR family winged helix-turn-helix transcriptional regulator n=1 Tax=Clostridium sp. E02 TaxID=2487134 RepID=UPI000F54C489|nr:winged helix-turn-helix transcriptional regulator [Clostridium sp. E02]